MARAERPGKPPGTCDPRRVFTTCIETIGAARAVGAILPELTEGGFAMSYVDGFVLPVPKENLPAYRRMAKKAGAIWREHGALQVCESIGDDVKVGKVTSFPQSVKLKPGETVVFS